MDFFFFSFFKNRVETYLNMLYNINVPDEYTLKNF